VPGAFHGVRDLFRINIAEGDAYGGADYIADHIEDARRAGRVAELNELHAGGDDKGQQGGSEDGEEAAAALPAGEESEDTERNVKQYVDRRVS